MADRTVRTQPGQRVAGRQQADGIPDANPPSRRKRQTGPAWRSCALAGRAGLSVRIGSLKHRVRAELS